jgi:hypothetical protein
VRMKVLWIPSYRSSQGISALENLRRRWGAGALAMAPSLAVARRKAHALFDAWAGEMRQQGRF